MRTEDKVTSLELSKALKEAGAKQESEWSYDKDRHLWNVRDQRTKASLVASAFDCAELLERLPECSRLEKRQSLSFLASNWWLDHTAGSRTPAEALGKLYLWCLKEGHCSE